MWSTARVAGVKLLLLACIALTMATLVALTSVVTTASGEPVNPAGHPTATIASLGSRDSMRLTSFCGGKPVGAHGLADLCADILGGEPGAVTVRAAHRIHVRLNRPAARLKADVVSRVDGETQQQYPGIAHGHHVPGSDGHRWVFRFDDVYDANAILVYVHFRSLVPYGKYLLSSATFASHFELATSDQPAETAGAETAAGGHRCPRGVPDSEQFRGDRLEGLRYERAKKLAKRHGCTVRIVKLDGVSLPGTDEYAPNRINVSVVAGRIEEVTGIG